MSLFFWTGGSLHLGELSHSSALTAHFWSFRSGLVQGSLQDPFIWTCEMKLQGLKVFWLCEMCQISTLIKIRGHLRSSSWTAVVIILPVWYESSWGKSSRHVLLQTAAVPPTSTDLNNNNASTLGGRLSSKTSWKGLQSMVVDQQCDTIHQNTIYTFQRLEHHGNRQHHHIFASSSQRNDHQNIVKLYSEVSDR